MASTLLPLSLTLVEVSCEWWTHSAVGWILSLPKMRAGPKPQPCGYSHILFGNRIFVDVIYKLGGSLTQDDWYFYEKREMWVWKPTQIEKAMCRWRQRLKWCVCKKRIPETAFYHQELGRGKGRCPFTVFRESFALLTLWVWTSNLHKNDRMQFCCFKPSSLWSFVMAVLENKYIF